jgi:hypothetical protein
LEFVLGRRPDVVEHAAHEFQLRGAEHDPLVYLVDDDVATLAIRQEQTGRCKLLPSLRCKQP